MMNELTVIEQPSVPTFSYHDIERIAGAFAQSRMFGVSDPAAALSLCLLAQAEGQHPAIAFRDYSIIQGKPAKKAEAMQRDFLASGGKIKWIELSDTCAKAEFSHPSGGSLVIDWTMDRAKAAGIGGKDMWKKYPRQMLRSRTISEGVRSVCPMATSGMYVPEEVADFDNKTEIAIETGEVIEATPVVEREKVKGIHAIKQRLGKLLTEGNAATDLDAFNALLKAHRDDLKTLRDANHEWWTGDGEDFEGFSAWKERRKAELSAPADSLSLQMLASCINECDSRNDLNGLLDQHGAVIDELDDAERRKFDALYEAREAALMAIANVGAG
jgi:hypothetical protein